jgi:hypothetical protein
MKVLLRLAIGKWRHTRSRHSSSEIVVQKDKHHSDSTNISDLHQKVLEVVVQPNEYVRVANTLTMWYVPTKLGRAGQIGA